MKNIILIGKMNDIISQLYADFSREYRVNIMVDGYYDTECFEKMVDLIKPELVFVSLVGIHDEIPDIFTIMLNHYPNTPVITLGNEKEYADYKTKTIGDQFIHLMRPISEVDIEFRVKQLLSTKKKVIIVDDDPVLLRTVKLMLEDSYDVFLAPSGSKGLSMMKKYKPDIVLLDYEMPEMDGKDVLWQIRNDDDLKSMSVVFLTGINDMKHIKDIVFLKPDAYLLKPPVKDVLLQELSKIN